MARFLCGLVAILVVCSTAGAQRPAVRKKAVKDSANKLVGVWQSEGNIIVFEEKRLLIGATDTKSAVIVAEYAVAKDNTVFGIITSEKVSSNGALFPFVSFVDETFRFRVSLDKNELTIKHARFSAPRILGVESGLFGLFESDKQQRAKKGGTAATAGDDAYKSIFLVVLLLQRELERTYERTTKEAVENERLSLRSFFLSNAPASSTATPPKLPMKSPETMK